MLQKTNYEMKFTLSYILYMHVRMEDLSTFVNP